MPAANRLHPLTISSGDGTADRSELRARALDVLLDPDLAPIVEMTCWRADHPDGPTVSVATSMGACRFGLDDPDGDTERLWGDDPLARQDPLAFTPVEVERADRHPPAARNHYPYAARRLVSLFSATNRAPDICVVHTDAHYWPERSGHPGEHGSLSVLQSRAPFLLAGAGVHRRGLLTDHARVLDVGPTLAHLAGVPAASLADLDGVARTDLAGSGARHVVGLLWDGANAADLLDLAGTGLLPNVARLLARGCALTGGAVAEFPSSTLVNHTSALTGLAPGRHGIVNNEFYDRTRDERVIANDEATWHRACDLLRPGVQTLWERLSTARPGAICACVDEPIDRGASYSTFAIIRAAGASSGAKSMRNALPDPTADAHATQEWVRASADYAWSSQVDASGLAQVLHVWNQPEPPALTWWNTTLTDTGHHGGGPFSEQSRASLADSDRRLGVWFDLVEAQGRLDDTVVLLTADHGSVGADPDCRGDWDAALTAAGIAFRDEAYGFLYLG